MTFSETSVAEILSYADSNHYLVAITSDDAVNPVLVKDRLSAPRAFKGLAQAKQWLKDQGFREAYLRLETAYDEMVSEPSPPHSIRMRLH